MPDKRAVLYARVSTDEQAGNYSLQTQIDACRKYAEEHGFQVVMEFSDDYSGATPIEARPDGRKAYKALTSEIADALVAYRVDRLARPPQEGDEWDIPILIRGLAKLGKEIHIVNRGKLDTSFVGLLTAVLDGKGAGDERRNIMERSRRGVRAKAASGKVVGCGRWPYGYRYSDDQFIIVEPEAKVIRMIFDWFTGTNCAPLTINKIAVELTKMGTPTPAERPHQTMRKLPPGVWAYSHVWGILTNKTYIGVWRFGKNGRHGKNPESNIIEVPVPPIIGVAQWEAAQEQRAFNSKFAMRNAKREYLLRSIVKCDKCKRTMVGSYNPTNGFYYYRCPNGHTRPGYERCPQKDLRGDILDFAVWEYILDVMTDEEKFEQGLLDTQAELEKGIEPKRAQFETIEAMIAETEAESERLAVVLTQVTGKVKKSLQSQIDTVNTRYDEQCAKRDKILAAIQDQGTLTQDDIHDALKTRARIIKGLRNPTFSMKRQFLQFLHVTASASGTKITMNCSLKIERVIDLASRVDCQ